MPIANLTIDLAAPEIPPAPPPELPPTPPPIIPEEMKLPLILLGGGVAVLVVALAARRK